MTAFANQWEQARTHADRLHGCHVRWSLARSRKLGEEVEDRVGRQGTEIADHAGGGEVSEGGCRRRLASESVYRCELFQAGDGGAPAAPVMGPGQWSRGAHLAMLVTSGARVASVIPSKVPS